MKAVAHAALVVLVAACTNRPSNKIEVAFTRIPASLSVIKKDGTTGFRYAPGMKIMRVLIEDIDKKPEPLTEQFHSARAPQISYDGASMVFSGQKEEHDVWQLWIMDLVRNSVQRVTSSSMNCTDPTWAPDGAIIFSKLVKDQAIDMQYHALFRIEPDGCCEQRLSFQPHDDLDASILNDGRILVRSTMVFPHRGTTKFLAMRPDGTKAELFYQARSKDELNGPAYDNFSGKVLFTESGKLAFVKFSRPLHSRQLVTVPEFEHVQSVNPMNEYRFLLSARKSEERTYGISVVNDSWESTYDISESGFHYIEPVLIDTRRLPKRLPSRVNPELQTGYMICINSDDSQLPAGIPNARSSRIQIIGLEGPMGETTIEEDGSFYLELKADVPVRFQTLNNQGEVVRGPSAWTWIRPNERRGCVGCHANQEIAPGNVVPNAIEKAPFAMIN